MAIKAADPDTTADAVAPRAWLATLVKGRPRGSLPGADVLGDSLAVFDRSTVRTAPDGYPIVRGTVGDRTLELSFIPDTLAIKRLPQLWLSLVLRSEHSYAPVVLTARPRGDEYVSLRREVGAQVEVPGWLPRDFEVRGGADTQALLETLRGPVCAMFADANAKELAFTRGRVHLLSRLSQGRRGMHLLLRRPVFDDVLTQEKLRSLLASLLRLESAGGS